MKKTWQGIKEIINLNNKSGPKISQLKYDGKQINENKDMANRSMIFSPKWVLSWIKKSPALEEIGIPPSTSNREFLSRFLLPLLPHKKSMT